MKWSSNWKVKMCGHWKFFIGPGFVHDPNTTQAFVFIEKKKKYIYNIKTFSVPAEFIKTAILGLEQA